MNRPLIVAGTAVLLLALTACGSGSGAAGGAPASGGDGPAPSTTPAVSGSDKASANVDLCTVLPVADVSRITGVHYTRTKSTSVMGQVFGCEYTNAQFALLQVTVTVTNGPIAYDADVQAMSSTGHGPEPVTGVGDKAFAIPDPQGNAGSAGAAAFASYGALFGDQYVKIGGSYVTPEEGRQLVDEVHQGS